MRKRNEHKARDKRRLLAETLPAPRRVAVSPFVPWVSWRSFGFLQCVMLLQLIFAWDPFLVGAMDTSVPKDVMHRRIKEWGLQKPQHSKNPVWKWARKYRNPPLSGLHVGFYDTGFRI